MRSAKGEAVIFAIQHIQSEKEKKRQEEVVATVTAINVDTSRDFASRSSHIRLLIQCHPILFRALRSLTSSYCTVNFFAITTNRNYYVLCNFSY